MFRFSTLGVFYYRGSHGRLFNLFNIHFSGAVLVYDITDANSFTRVQIWVKELRKVLGNDVVLAIVGNKIDLERSRVVSQTVFNFSLTY